MTQPQGPILIFDGGCALCHWGVRVTLSHERTLGEIRFAPMQSERGRAMLHDHGFDPDAMSSMVLVEGGVAHVRSRAVVRLARRLRAPWGWARFLGVIPAWAMDPFYRVVARTRHAVFGRADVCELDPRLEGRMV